MTKHAVKCKKFPDPFDERDPVGPCTCGAEERTSNQWGASELALLRRAMASNPSKSDEIIASLADEIERLTAELATMREAHGTYVELYPKVCTERDRLRAALDGVRRVLREAKDINHSLPPVFSEIHGLIRAADETTESP